MTPAARKPRLGFLGVGWIGRHRLAAVAEAQTAEIVALADSAKANLEEARALAPDAEILTNLDDLLEQQLDGVVIATPSALHAEQSIRALQHGLAVFCQKPLARTGAEVRAVIAAARKADRLLGVDLSYRHVRGIVAMRDMILRGDLGQIFAVDLVFHNAYGPGKPWFYDRALSGGGCVIDLGIHLVDAALWMLHSPVVRISSALYAEGRPLLPGAHSIEDFASVRLELEAGTLVNLACSWKLHAGQDAVIEASFYGTEGGASLRNIGGSFTAFRTEAFTGTTRRTLAEPPDPWGGGAILAWTRQLQESRRFHREIESHAEVAEVLDRIYGVPEPEPQ